MGKALCPILGHSTISVLLTNVGRTRVKWEIPAEPPLGRATWSRRLKPAARTGKLWFIRDFREAYSRSLMTRDQPGRRFLRAGAGGLEAGRLWLIALRATEGGAVRGRKLPCFKHLRSFRALNPPRRSRFLYPGNRG